MQGSGRTLLPCSSWNVNLGPCLPSIIGKLCSSSSGHNGGGGPPRDVECETPRLVLDPPRVEGGGSMNEPGRTRSSPFSAGRPREEVWLRKGWIGGRWIQRLRLLNPGLDPNAADSSTGPLKSK